MRNGEDGGGHDRRGGDGMNAGPSAAPHEGSRMDNMGLYHPQNQQQQQRHHEQQQQQHYQQQHQQYHQQYYPPAGYPYYPPPPKPHPGG
ncbi:hypothetical protein Naga_100622g1 [Nannochloropsis gaditana]|uniref:Uncharacterized protein n=1 Tax=Nannochloropsis gaditana TaxID=72520 RepID=W7TK30_9STRA|nr:hypothetical protein Naga_100622g1 [Nannochloropsis gaditana]